MISPLPSSERRLKISRKFVRNFFEKFDSIRAFSSLRCFERERRRGIVDVEKKITGDDDRERSRQA